MANDLIRARLVYDGGNDVFIPPEMGEPRDDQMQGTPAERLCELAGRVCYDSLGKGRPSFTRCDPPLHVDEGGLEKPGIIQGYHDHIREVGHGSVLEHFNFTVEVGPFENINVLHSIPGSLLNRPGVWAVYRRGIFRITLNLRSLVEWDAMSMYGKGSDSDVLGQRIADAAARLAPHITKESSGLYRKAYDAFIEKPDYDEECWISLFMSGSRGLSHELVRHGDFTAISQRSTRFVDESESPWVMHPLMGQYLGDGDPPANTPQDTIADEIVHAREECCHLYDEAVSHLEPWLISRGLDRTSARKQARGAARGYLGNALYTELIFSANVAQWKRMLRQRASRFADAEIRELFCKALVELKRSRYGERFKDFELAPSPDGIGQVAIEAE
jgi:hypothetical protein